MGKRYYCEADYSRVSLLPFKGKAYHITINGGSDFKPAGMQTDEDYRRLFNAIDKYCREQIKALDKNNYGGFQFVLCGGTSFIHGSSITRNEEAGKAHLHMILYTNCNALPGNEVDGANGYKKCKGGLIEKWLLEKYDGFKKGYLIGINVSPFATCETIDYVLQQRVEPEPLWESSISGLHVKSLLKNIVKQYPYGKNYKASLRKWDRNITAVVEQVLLETNSIPFAPIKVVANPPRLKVLGRGGMLEIKLLQKALTLANTRQRHRQALRLEIAGVVTGFEEWLKDKPLIAQYLIRTYWNNSLTDRVNSIAGEEIIPKLVTYTKYIGQKEKAEYWTRHYVDGRTTEGRKLKEDGWR